jgi:iron complex outermembrane receptor protein
MKRITRDRAALAGASALALIMAAGQAQAQDAKAKADASTVSEVVVTAQFREQNLQKTPLAITAVNGAMLDARAQTRLTDVAAQAPNVQLEPNPAGAGNGMRAFIRGVGQADQDPAVDPGVGIYVDDVYFSTITGSIFDLLDLDRIEILRGPQGTLSGMNSLGGSVKLYSKKPDGNGGGYLEGTLGSLHRTDVRGSVDFTVVPDQLFVRLSGVSRHHDGYVTRLDYACVHPNDPYVISGALPRQNSNPDCKLGTEGNQDMTALRAALRWTPSSKLDVNLIGDWTNDNSETQAATLLRAGEIIPGASLAYQGVPYDNRFVPYGQFRGDTVINDPYVTYSNFSSPGVTYRPIDTAGTPGAPNGPWSVAPKDAIQSWGVSGTIDWAAAPNLNIKSISGYRHYVATSTEDNDGSPVAILMEEAKFTHEQYSEELRATGTVLGSVDYTVGGIYFHQKTIYASREHNPWLAGIYGPLSKPTFDFLQDDPTVVHTEAGFAHLSWRATDKLTLNGGVRYTHEHKSYTFYRLNIDGQTPFLILSNPADPLNGRSGVYSGGHWDWRADVQYQWTPDVMTYAQFSTGFKGGGISPRPYFPEQIHAFGPETLNAYELGAKSYLFDRRMRLNLAAFYNQYNDYQATPNVCVDASGNPLPLPFGTPGLCGQYLNVADAKVKGVELETEIHPIPGMLIDGSISYLKFKFGTPKIATSAVRAGAQAPGIGDLKWSLGAQYEIPFLGGGELIPRLDVLHTPGYCSDLNCTAVAKVDNHTLLNGRLTYRSEDEKWSASLEVTNLTNKLYYINKFNSAYLDGQPGMPREWSISLRRSF